MDSGGLGSVSGSIELDAAKALAALTQVSTGLRNLDSQSRSQGGGLLDWANKNEQSLKTIGTGLTGVGLAITGAFGLATHTAMNFDAQISAVGSVAGASKDELSALRDEALRLGADTTLGATEAASAMEVLLKAGAPLEAVLDGAAEAAINLAEATGVDITLAAETAATAMNIFKTDAKTAADTIAQSANASSLDVGDWALALKSAGPIAKSLGLDMEDLAQSLVILGDAGIKGETAGTALRNILMGLADPAGDAALYINELGVATHNVDGSFRGLEEVTHDLAGAWGEMNAEQKFNIATMVAGEQGAASFIAIMDAQAESVRNGGDAFQEASTRMDDTGTVAEQAAARMDNLKGSFEQLKGTIETIAITFTSGLAPGMRVVVDALNTVLQGVLALPAPVKTAVAALTGIAGAAALGAGGFLLLLPRIAETRNALQDLSKAPGIIGRISSSVLGLGTSATRASVGVGGLRGALMGLVRAHPALIGFGLIAGGLYAAYRTNFLGIADLVDGVAGKVKSVFADMSAAFNASGESAGVAAEDVAAFAEATHVADGKTVYTAFVTNADGTKREVGEIIESVANADGKTAQVLIKGEDGEYWATIDLATGEISNAEITVEANTKPLADRVNDALQVLEDRFNEAGMGWAASVVDNVQKIVSTVSSMASKLRTVFTALSPSVKSFLSQIAAAAVVLAPLGAGIGLVVKAFSTLSPVLSAARLAIQGVGLAIAVLTSPIGLIVVGIAALAAGLIYAYNHFEGFRNVVDSVVDTVQRFWEAIASGEALNKLQQMSDDVQRWFQDTADGIMSGIRETWDGITSAVTDALSGARDIVAGIWDGIATGVGAAWSAIQNGISLAWNAITSLTWSDFIPDVAWTAFITVLDWAGRIASFAWDTFLTVLDWGVYVAKLAWGAWLTVLSWGQYVTDLAWSGFLTTLDWALYVAKLVWSGFITAVDLGTYVVRLAWSSFVTALSSWSDFIPDISWSSFIPDFQWPSPGEVLNAIVKAVTGRGDTPSTKHEGSENVKPEPVPAPGQGPILNPYQGGKMPPGGGKPFPTVGYVPDRGPLDAYVAAFADAVASITTAMMNMQVAVASGLSSITSAFTSGFTLVQTIVASAMSSSSSAMTTGVLQIQVTASSGLASTVSAFTTAFLQVQVTTSSAMSSTAAAVSSGMLMIQATTASGMSSLTSAVRSGFTQVQTTVASAMSSTTSAVTSGMTQIQSTVASAMSSVVSAARSGGQQMASALTSGAQQGLNGVRGALSQIPGIVSSIGGSAAAAAYSIGANISSSMASGMLSALGTIQAAASAMVAAADTALRARASIASPSKLFTRLGAYIGEGFELGIRSMIPDASRAAAALVNVPGLAGNAYGTTYAPAYAYATPAASHVTNIVNVYPLKSDEYQQLISDAQTGGGYARARMQPTAAAQYVRRR